jgi:HlyD family secretion protein
LSQDQSLSRRRHGRRIAAALLSLGTIGGLWALAANTGSADLPGVPAVATTPALTVTTVRLDREEWRRTLEASGNIAAWQEVVIGPELSGYRLTEVLVEVGDWVRKGQLLARISSDQVVADLAQARAALAEAEASLAEAKADGKRARQLRGTAALSVQQADQYLTAEQTARARLEATRAKVQSEELRLRETQVTAPDDGVISARSIAVGSLAQTGQEMLRLIRGGRLEWRAEVASVDMGRLERGGRAMVMAPDGTRILGRIRRIAPTVDKHDLTGLVYVDLPRCAPACSCAGSWIWGRRRP